MFFNFTHFIILDFALLGVKLTMCKRSNLVPKSWKRSCKSESFTRRTNLSWLDKRWYIKFLLNLRLTVIISTDIFRRYSLGGATCAGKDEYLGKTVPLCPSSPLPSRCRRLLYDLDTEMGRVLGKPREHNGTTQFFAICGVLLFTIDYFRCSFAVVTKVVCVLSW